MPFDNSAGFIAVEVERKLCRQASVKNVTAKGKTSALVKHAPYCLGEETLGWGGSEGRGGTGTNMTHQHGVNNSSCYCHGTKGQLFKSQERLAQYRHRHAQQ